jgi:hypothetical protein
MKGWISDPAAAVEFIRHFEFRDSPLLQVAKPECKGSNVSALVYQYGDQVLSVRTIEKGRRTRLSWQVQDSCLHGRASTTKEIHALQPHPLPSGKPGNTGHGFCPMQVCNYRVLRPGRMTVAFSGHLRRAVVRRTLMLSTSPPANGIDLSQ